MGLTAQARNRPAGKGCEVKVERLKGKVCLITGAAHGIGAAMAQSFVAEGARVIISDVDAAAGQDLVTKLGPQSSFVWLDVADEAQWTSVMGGIRDTHHRLDVLVNNAGITGLGSGRAHDPEHGLLDDWHRVMRVNLDGVFLGCKHFIQSARLTQSVGSIINMSSRSGLVGIPHAAAYAASKAAVRNHSKTVALYCAEENLGIRCNSIHPAAIRTAMWDAMLKGGDEQPVIDSTPLHRFGRPEEVAAIAVLLASDEATFITGSEFNIDGGILAGAAAAPKPGE
jgi:3(or 17)beta-hydroxysteroid dehydrogenase